MVRAKMQAPKHPAIINDNSEAGDYSSVRTNDPRSCIKRTFCTPSQGDLSDEDIITQAHAVYRTETHNRAIPYCALDAWFEDKEGKFRRFAGGTSQAQELVAPGLAIRLASWRTYHIVPRQSTMFYS